MIVSVTLVLMGTGFVVLAVLIYFMVKKPGWGRWRGFKDDKLPLP